MMEQTHFGYRKVDSDKKASLVGEVFNKVAPYYDVMNDAMSLGLHRIWKNKLLEMLAPKANTHLVDVAGGTGDIAFRFLKAAPTSDVTVVDINSAMLHEGQKNAINRNLLTGLQWVCADAQSLPLPSDHYDYYTIAFGIRNVTDIQAALNEAYRVLKPGGRFMCLEFSKVKQPLLGKWYDMYSFHVIPRLGEWIAKDADSYRYLVESIRMFPDQETFKAMIEKAGFHEVNYTNMTQGVVAIHSGWKP